MNKILSSTAIIAVFATSTSQASITYLDTDFDQQNVTGPFTLPATSNFTELLNTGNNLGNTTIEENLTTVAVDTEPTGQHLRIDGNRDKHASMENAMTLLTDGVSSFDVSYSYLLSGNINQNKLRVFYSASGNFDDSVLLKNYVVTGSSLVNGGDTTQTVISENQWFQESFTVTNSDVTFSDTAKLRFSQDTGGAISTGAYVDDIMVTAVPEPSTTALLGLGGLALILRRRK